jgi:outer membrane immunogenic protein
MTGVSSFMPQFDHGTQGATAGLVGGYNRVLNNGLFYGGEADLNYMRSAGDLDFHFAAYGIGFETVDLKSVWSGYSTVRGRLGVALDPALLFVTGGFALAEVKDTFNANPFGGTDYFDSHGLQAGGTIGAGAEFALTSNISLSMQYLRLQMLSHMVTFTEDDNSGGTAKVRLMNAASILRLGLNWHFD